MKACYLLRRAHRKPLYLTPFVDPAQAATWNEDEEIQWLVSTGVHAQEKDEALLTLYQQIDRGVDRWIQDARYIPRLLISAAIFLLTYFFFSLAVRDPLPMIDELLISVAVSIVTATLLARRDTKSEMAMKRRLALKQQASQCKFTVQEPLGDYEDCLDACEAIETIDLAERLALTSDKELPPRPTPDNSAIDSVHDLLIQQVKLSDKNLYRRYVKVMEVHHAGVPDEALAAHLVKLALAGTFDLSLLAFLVTLEK